MIVEDFIAIKKFEELFGGSVFQEEPGDRWIYEKNERCYSLPDNYLEIIKQSINENKDYLLESGTEIKYNPDAIY